MALELIYQEQQKQYVDCAFEQGTPLDPVFAACSRRPHYVQQCVHISKLHYLVIKNTKRTIGNMANEQECILTVLGAQLNKGQLHRRIYYGMLAGIYLT